MGATPALAAETAVGVESMSPVMPRGTTATIRKLQTRWSQACLEVGEGQLNVVPVSSTSRPLCLTA